MRGRDQASAVRGATAKKEVVRAEGLEPSRGLRPNGYSCRLRLSPPCRNGVVGRPAGLWSGLYLHHDRPVFRRSVVGAARLVSTPSPPEFSVGAWLGIAISGFPEFEQFCIAGFPASTQVALKSDASADSATPAWPT